MKVSELKTFLESLPEDKDPDLVTGEEWLPERLTELHLNGDMLHLEFDNAPEETAGDDEARGFVEHEIVMLRDKIEALMGATHDPKAKAEVFLRLFIMAHEKSSSEVIEILEDPESWEL